MTARHRRPDTGELAIVERDARAAATWAQRNPHTVAWLWHLALGTGVVSTFVAEHSAAVRTIAAVAGIVASMLGQVAAVNRSTPTADPRNDDGLPLVPAPDASSSSS